MGGFTIICNKCGKETIVTENMEYTDKGIEVIATGYGGELGIMCNCGNRVED